MSSMNGSILVSVESRATNPVVEVTYDGQEIVQPPITAEQHLTKQALKIDFDNLDAEDEEDQGGEAREVKELRKARAEDDDKVATSHCILQKLQVQALDCKRRTRTMSAPPNQLRRPSH